MRVTESEVIEQVVIESEVIEYVATEDGVKM